MSLRRGLLSTVLLLSIMSAACGGDPPDKEMQQAQTAIDTARAAGAEQYAAAELTAAEEALKGAKIAVEQRDYRLALNDALDSRERAQNASKQAADAKASERESADHAISDATSALAVLNRQLKTAEAAHAAPRVLTAARSVITDVTPRLQEARTAYGRADYPAATSTASAATEQINDAVDELQSVLAPSSRRHR